MPPLVRFPAGHVTPHGAYHILADRIPQVALLSYDETVVFNLMGGLSIADKVNAPGRVEIKDMKGLMAPWRVIDQKGATEDGVTFVDALYDPIEVQIDVRVRGKDPADARRVARYLRDSLDVKRTSQFSWFTHDMCYWWADLRWFKQPIDSVGAIRNSTEDISLVLRADNGFYKTFPSVDAFTFTYRAMEETFDTPYDKGVGPNWPLHYTPSNSDGYLYVDNGEAKWRDDPDTLFLTQGAEVVAGPRRGFETTDDNQVVSMQFGSFQEWTFPDRSSNHLWARMNRNPDGSWAGTGVKLEISMNELELAYYVNFVKVGVIGRKNFWFPPPIPGERFTLIAGVPGSPRTFRVMRNKAAMWTVVERGEGSKIGAPYKGLGWGSRAGAALITQATPASIRDFAGGDNRTITQEGYVHLSNPGDQVMFGTAICCGPGTFRIWDGPNAGPKEYVEFGPLLENQVMFLRTDPRKRGVRDMTSVPSGVQQAAIQDLGLRSFLDFGTANNATPLANELASVFGVKAPQGQPYSLLKGRWSRGLEPKSPGRRAELQPIKVSIVDGNADSKIIYSGTPLRRMPY